MRILEGSGGTVVWFLLSVIICSSFLCHGRVVEVVGVAQSITLNTPHVFSGLGVTVDCKAEQGHFVTRGTGKLDGDGKFTVSLTKDDIVGDDGTLKEECYAQLRSASALPCPSHDGLESSKIALLSKSGEKHVLGLKQNLRFSPETCVSKFFWHFPKFPWPHPIKGFHHLFPFPCPPKAPVYYPPPKKELPPPVPVYNPPPKEEPPPVPVYNPPPVKKPCPPKPPKKEIPPPVKKPCPPKPPKKEIPPPVKKPCPPKPPKKEVPPPKKEVPPPVKKPCPPKPPKKEIPPPVVYEPPPKKEIPPPVVYEPPPKKEVPPPVPVPVIPKKPCPPIKLPPVVLPPITIPKKPCPPIKLPPVVLPPITIPKKPCPPFPPKFFNHPKFGKWPPLPPFPSHP